MFVERVLKAAGAFPARTSINECGANEVMSEAQQKRELETPEGAGADVGQERFAALGLGAEALRAIADLGFSEPTPIQEQTIALLLAGRDVIAQAPTGTGKTAAYGLPIVEQLDVSVLEPQALVVVPTRELAIQVSEALLGLGKYRELVALPIYGGAPYERQLRALARGVQVVVGTPGRLLDHLGRGTLRLGAVRTVVLDEADEMLDMGFIEDIEAILAALPEQRQSALFSATIPPRIAALAERYLRTPQHISVAAREAVAPRVRQVYYEVAGHAKPEALARILDLETPESAIIFVRTRRDADIVAEQLNGQGYLAQAIHGEINQSQRERIMERFRAGHTQLLVATDVAARGLDIPDVSHIINYDLPLDAESYVHRIGRTGRAGATGEALTLVTPRERRMLQSIERAIHRRLERLRLPTPADVAARRRAEFREDLLAILDGGQLDVYLALVEDLAGTHDAAELAAAAFKMAAQAREARRPGRGETWVVPPVAPPVAETPEPEAAGPAPEPAGRRAGRGAPARKERAPRAHRVAPAAMTRLFLRVGKRDGVRPADVVGAIANEAGVPGDAIGDIDLYDTFSFVEVPQDVADSVRVALNATTIRGRSPRASVALPQDEWPAEEDQEDRRPARPTGRGRFEGEREARRPGERWERERREERRSLRVPRAAARTPFAGRKGGSRSERPFERRGQR